MRDVVITGIGTLGVSGAGLAEFEQGLVSGKLPLTELDRSLGFHRNAAPAHALVVSADALAQWIQPIEARRLCRPSKFAVCATRMALADAGLTGADRSDSAWEGTAVVLGYCWGSTAFSQRLLRQVEDPEVDAVSPVIFMETIANSPAAKMAMAHGLKGPNLTLTQRETSDVAAIARGASLIASGRVERVVAGVTGEVSEALHAVLGGFGALTSRDRGRPLDARRDGVIAAEGATIFVLESAQLCEARGARVRARLRGWGRANDPTATGTDWGDGAESLALGLKKALARFAIDRGSVRRIVSGASGSLRGDALDARVLRAVFGDELPVVLTPKAITGEYGGGYLASLLWALEATEAPNHMATEEPDPELAICAAGGGELGARGRVLASSLASGGGANWLVLDRP